MANERVTASRPSGDAGRLDAVRERLETLQAELSPHAARALGAGDRAASERPDLLRTAFQRDRDRIVHTKSFRRLKHKSQVFVAPLGDHYVTRLTHTLEVAQIGRTIARALNLNEDLVEAAALGHDLGHTPFGHIGERVLDGLIDSGFHHSRHSVRIVEKLEKGGSGLNLTSNVIEAIRRHSKPAGEFLTIEAVAGLSLEAQIVRIADAIAYLAHDVGDAIRSGQLTLDDLPPLAIETLGRRHSERVNTLVTDTVEASWSATGELDDRDGTPWIRMSDAVGAAMIELRTFMFERFYLPIGEMPSGRAAARIVELLFEHYRRAPGRIPGPTRALAVSDEQAAADYVCGMTDHFALRTAEEISPGIAGDAFEGRV